MSQVVSRPIGFSVIFWPLVLYPYVAVVALGNP